MNYEKDLERNAQMLADAASIDEVILEQTAAELAYERIYDDPYATNTEIIDAVWRKITAKNDGTAAQLGEVLLNVSVMKLEIEALIDRTRQLGN